MNTRENDLTSAASDTCFWLQEHPKYIDWLSQPRGLLWIKGKPGAGKSTLLKHAILRIKSETSKFPKAPTTIAFFFHGRGTEIQKTSLGLFRSLSHQLFAQFPDAFSNLFETFTTRCETMGEPGDKWDWHSQELKEFFDASLPKVLESSAVRIFVDALDESGEETAVYLVKYFRRLISSPIPTKQRLSLCFSCRHYPVISVAERHEIVVENETNADIRTYVECGLSQCTGYGFEKIELALLRQEIVSRASGSFLWAALILPKIFLSGINGKSIRKIQDEIRQTPKELHEIYRDILQNLHEQQKSNQLFQWICFALRPLSLAELRCALNADVDTSFRSLRECQSLPDYVETDERMKRRLNSLSGGLAEIRTHEYEQRVQLIHQSVSDYILEEGLKLLDGSSEPTSTLVGRAHVRILRSCIKYIDMKEMRQQGDKINKFFAIQYPGRDVGEDFESSTAQDILYSRSQLFGQKFPLLNYAIKSWLLHAKAAESNKISQEELLAFLNWPSNQLLQRLEKSQRVIDPDSSVFRQGQTFLHVASFYGLTSFVTTILQNLNHENVIANLKDSRGQTPLSFAAEYRYLPDSYDSVIKQLLNRDDVDADSKDITDRTPRSWVVGSKHYQFMDDYQCRINKAERLLKRDDVDVNSKDRDGWTPLDWAESAGNTELVELLGSKTSP